MWIFYFLGNKNNIFCEQNNKKYYDYDNIITNVTTTITQKLYLFFTTL